MNRAGGYQQHNKLMLGLFLWFVTSQFEKGYVVKFILSKPFHYYLVSATISFGLIEFCG